MSEIKKIKVAGVEYGIADEVNREELQNFKKETTNAENDIKSKAVHYNTLGFSASADRINLYGKSVDGSNTISQDIPAATTTTAGVMTAEDKKKLDGTSTAVDWTSSSNMNDYIEPGVYEITGTRTAVSDNLPITNTGENATIAARLIVTQTPEGATIYRHSVGQTLILSNAEGKETKVYTRNGNRTSYDGGVSYTVDWGEWQTLQSNINVGQVANLDSLTDNGIYSGVWTTGSYNAYPLTFVCISINDYFVGVSPRRVSQFVYGLSKMDGSVVYQSRVGVGDSSITWGNWEIVNEKAISSMITAEISKVVDGAPETFDTLKEISNWIATHGNDAASMLAAIQTNQTLINNEASRATTAENDIKSKAAHYNTLGFSASADRINLYGKSVDGSNTISQDIPAATTTTAGVMTAEDKKTLNSAVEEGKKLALRSLYIAAGATYDKSTGLYSLNGVNDLTEEQMLVCYENKDICRNLNWGGIGRYMSNLRTIYPIPVRDTISVSQLTNGWKWNCLYAFYYCVALEIFRISTNASLDTTEPSKMLAADRLFWAFHSCVKLHTVYPINVGEMTKSMPFQNTFYGCSSLVNLRLYGLKDSISLAQSPLISKESLLYIINNSQATSAITITLHADAYATLAEDTDIISVLEAQPLVTLVSA